MRNKVVNQRMILICIDIIICAFACQAMAGEKVLVEFGWDEPDTAFLKRQIAQVERSPFDGCVFHAVARTDGGAVENFAWKAWSRREFSGAELAGAMDDLKTTRPGRLTANFLRINTTPADLD